MASSGSTMTLGMHSQALIEIELKRMQTSVTCVTHIRGSKVIEENLPQLV